MKTECRNETLTWKQANEDLEDAIYLADKQYQLRHEHDGDEAMIETEGDN